MIRVRYRPGVVGETRRVVHAAEPTGSTAQTLCGTELSVADVEIVEYGGMPCMPCTARAALAAAGRDQTDTELPSAATFEETNPPPDRTSSCPMQPC